MMFTDGRNIQFAREVAPMPHPHVRAAFINAIAEEGTKADAIEFLQKQWNETCALRHLLREGLLAARPNDWDERVVLALKD